MGLKSLMEDLKKRGSVTAATSENSAPLQRKAPIHAGCTAETAVTPLLSVTRQSALFGQFGEAVNDPAAPEGQCQQSAAPPMLEVPAKRSFMEEATAWRELDKAYQAHHFKCSACIAAGLGYGLRCGVGAALWTAYSGDSIEKATP